MWELDHKESWVPKNWYFWTVVLEKTLESPLDSKEIQPILKEISPEYSLEGLMLKLTLQYFGHLMQELTHWKRPWCWERLKAGGEGDDRGWDGWMASPTQWAWVCSGSWWWTGRPGMLQSMGLQSLTRLSDWTELKNKIKRQPPVLHTVPWHFKPLKETVKARGSSTNQNTYFDEFSVLFHQTHNQDSFIAEFITKLKTK